MRATPFQGLSHHGKDSFLAALMRIPHGLRTMYVHAYQSYLWNAATSQRCREYGTDRVVEGDLVLLTDKAQDAGTQGNSSCEITQPSSCTHMAYLPNHMV